MLAHVKIIGRTDTKAFSEANSEDTSETRSGKLRSQSMLIEFYLDRVISPPLANATSC